MSECGRLTAALLATVAAVAATVLPALRSTRIDLAHERSNKADCDEIKTSGVLILVKSGHLHGKTTKWSK
jgi:hypothetical protein